MDSDRLDDAVERLERSLELQRSLAVEGRLPPSLSAELANGQNHLAALELLRGRHRQGVAAAEAGLEQIARARSAAPRNPLWQELERILRFNLGRCRIEIAEWREAADAAQAIDAGAGHEWLSRRAQLFERASRIAATDAGLEPEEREREARTLRDQALANLERAVELGRAEFDELADHNEWATLRTEARFKALVERAVGKR